MKIKNLTNNIFIFALLISLITSSNAEEKFVSLKKDKVNDGGAICSGGDNGKRCHGALPSNLLDGCTQLGRLLKSL